MEGSDDLFGVSTPVAAESLPQSQRPVLFAVSQQSGFPADRQCWNTASQHYAKSVKAGSSIGAIAIPTLIPYCFDIK